MSLDPCTQDSGVHFRRYTKGLESQYAFPDVFANQWQGGPAAFEIQLATTHVPVIQRREEFYEANGIRLAWIVGREENNLYRRAFRDIYMRNDGQILGMDGEVIAEARKAQAPRFRLYRLLPGLAEDGFAPEIADKIIGPENISWGARPRSLGPSYDAYLDAKIDRHALLGELRESFYEALSMTDEKKASEIWNTAAACTGGQRWEKLPTPYDTLRAFGVLATLRTGRRYASSRISLAQPRHLINSMVLEPKGRRCWTHALVLLCKGRGLSNLLDTESVQNKCVRNRLQQSTGMPPDRAAGPVFNVFFPEGAFARFDLEAQALE